MSPSNDENATALKLLAQMGVAGAGAAAVALGAPAVPVAAGTALVGKLIDEIPTQEGRKKNLEAIMTAVRAKLADETSTSLKEALLLAAGMAPDYQTEIDHLAAAVDDFRDKDRSAERKLFLTALNALLKQTGKTDDLAEFNRLVEANRLHVHVEASGPGSSANYFDLREVPEVHIHVGKAVGEQSGPSADATFSTGEATFGKTDDEDLLHLFKRMARPLFGEVIYLAKASTAISGTAAQVEQAIQLLQFVESPGGIGREGLRQIVARVTKGGAGHGP